MKIKDYGMPIINDNNILYGDLLIHFNIIFPDKLSKDIKNNLRKVFDIENDNYDESINLTNIEYHKEINDMGKEEEEYSNIQCAQQ